MRMKNLISKEIKLPINDNSIIIRYFLEREAKVFLFIGFQYFKKYKFELKTPRCS